MVGYRSQKARSQEQSSGWSTMLIVRRHGSRFFYFFSARGYQCRPSEATTLYIINLVPKHGKKIYFYVGTTS